VGLERGPLSLVSTIEELLERNNSDSGLENREYGRSQESNRTSESIARNSDHKTTEAVILSTVSKHKLLNSVECKYNYCQKASGLIYVSLVSRH
jgi:hypothetical protein